MIAIIAAMAGEKRVIGKDNKLPWHIPEDLQNFKKLTSGNVIVMGRNTYESIGRPLPNRINIVVSRTMGGQEGVVVCTSFEDAIEKARSYGKDVFVVGGARMYAAALDVADTMYLSYVKGNYEGDTFFPAFDESDWDVEKREDYEQFELVVYRRKQ